MKHNDSLDGFRAVCVTLVLVAHFFPWSVFAFHGATLPLGRLGVIGFFVLSGYLITNILLNYADEIHDGRSRVASAFRRFFVRRVLRIFPLYFGVLFAFAFIFRYERLREQLLWHLTYTSNIGQAVWQIHFGLANHFWSLCVEEQFYLLWPLLVLTVSKARRRLLFTGACALSFAAAALWAYLDVPGKWAGTFPLGGSSLALSIGAYFAWHGRERVAAAGRASTFGRLAAAIVAAIVLATGDLMSGARELFLLDSSWAMISAYLIADLAAGKYRFFSFSPLAFVGRISYGIYVYHLMLGLLEYKVLGILRVDAEVDVWAAFAVKMIGTLSVAALSYFLYERHFLMLKARLAPEDGDRAAREGPTRASNGAALDSPIPKRSPSCEEITSE